MKQVFTTGILMLLFFSGCKQCTCMDPYAYTYENNVTPNGGKFKSDPGKCQYSTCIFYLLAADTTVNYTTVFPINMYMDDKLLGSITTAATVPGNVADVILPGSTYVFDSLPDNKLHRWVALSNNLVLYNDSIRANHLQYIPISISGK